jgi:hypothetical protein
MYFFQYATLPLANPPIFSRPKDLTITHTGAIEENKNYFKRFYDSSFAPTVPLNSIVGGLVAEQVVKV